jgi:hypothetical protein
MLSAGENGDSDYSQYIPKKTSSTVKKSGTYWKLNSLNKTAKCGVFNLEFAICGIEVIRHRIWPQK